MTAFAQKLQDIADELARLGYRASREGFSVITDAPRRQVLMSMSRHRVLFFRETHRHGFTQQRYIFQ